MSQAGINWADPGPFSRDLFPRFGLTPFATHFPSQTDRIHLHLRFPTGGDAATAPEFASAVTSNVGAQLAQLPRAEQTSDFHCVTTWTRRALR